MWNIKLLQGISHGNDYRQNQRWYAALNCIRYFYDA